MQKGLSFFFLIIPSVFVVSCRQVGVRGAGKEVTDQRNIASFTSIEIDAPVDAIISMQPAASNTLKLIGYQNLMKYINTEVKDGVLHIYTTDDVSLNTDKQAKVYITASSLNSLAISGVAEVDIHGAIAGREFALDVSGDGKVSIDTLIVQNFSSEISGVAKIKVNTGSANAAEYNVSGDGSISAYALLSNEVTSSISGTGSIEIYAKDKLSGHVSGAATIKYKGHPAITSETNGAGSIVNAN